MTKKDFLQCKANIRSLYEEGHDDLGEIEAIELVEELHSDKNYSFVVELYRSPFIEAMENLWVFEVAYALNEAKAYADAEQNKYGRFYLIIAQQDQSSRSLRTG